MTILKYQLYGKNSVGAYLSVNNKYGLYPFTLMRFSVEKSLFDKSTAAGIITSILPIASLIGSFIALIITSAGGGYIDIMIVATIATLLTFVGFVFVMREPKTSSA